MLGLGKIVEKVSDSIGLPEWVGDVASGITNAATGNWAAVVEDGLDLLPNVARGLGQDKLADVLEYADDAYSFGSSGGLDKILSGNKDDLLKLAKNGLEKSLKDRVLGGAGGKDGFDPIALFGQGAPNAASFVSTLRA
jgi:hypothetical protein